MKNIILICMAGMSTSMMVAKMKTAAQKKGMDAHIEAMAESAFDSYTGGTDVLLLGPQISYMEKEIRKKYEPKGIKVGVIEPRIYGMMDGESALNMALSLLDN